MNQLGADAMAYWQRWLPARYRQIPNPPSFFTELGEQAARQIADLSEQLAGIDPPGEQYLEKLGRLTAARQQARELVVRELIQLPPESTAETDPELAPSETATSETATSETATDGWIPVAEDPRHPYWARRTDT